MPTIFDNIETEFLENAAHNGLRDALKVARRGDFCVGYFNLRGWKHIDDVVETWQGDGAAPCRLLVGMQRLPQEDLPKLFADRADDDRIDNKTVARLKREAAMQFRRQLMIGIPTARDEAGLRKLAEQLRNGKLTVKLYLRHTLHAKLYLAHRDDSFNPASAQPDVDRNEEAKALLARRSYVA